jgi:uroporphyrinogen-III synthase
LSTWRLLLTRPEAECQALAGELARNGHYGSPLPMLLIEPRPQALVALPGSLERFTAVIVVSKPAAQLGLRWLMPDPALHRPRWFAVGAATAALLRQAGIDAQFPAQGDDSEALWQLPAFEAAMAAPRSRVLIVRGEGGREWLAERLGARGVAVEHLELYRRSVPDYPASAVAERLQAERLNGAVVSSGQGLEHLHRVAGAAWPELAARPLFVPSERVAALAQALGSRYPVNCRGAGSAALIAALATRSP